MFVLLDDDMILLLPRSGLVLMLCLFGIFDVCLDVLVGLLA